MKKLYKIEEGKVFCGVCGGFARYFDVDPTLVRVIWIIASLTLFSGVIAYFICALIMPTESSVIKVIKGDKDGK